MVVKITTVWYSGCGPKANNRNDLEMSHENCHVFLSTTLRWPNWLFPGHHPAIFFNAEDLLLDYYARRSCAWVIHTSNHFHANIAQCALIGESMLEVILNTPVTVLQQERVFKAREAVSAIGKAVSALGSWHGERVWKLSE
jgi:hypothetical protein